MSHSDYPAFELTLPPAESHFLRSQYSSPQVVIEYGSGGSTFLALESNHRSRIYSCETDKQWLSSLCDEIQKRQLQDRFTPIFCNIGPTRAWGNPCFEQRGSDVQRMNLFMRYASRPWDIVRSKNDNPTIILIDGRFRVACFLTALAFIRTNSLILFDDYTERPFYHCVEKFKRPTIKVGRMAVFHATPGLISIEQYLSHNQYLLDWR